MRNGTAAGFDAISQLLNPATIVNTLRQVQAHDETKRKNDAFKSAVDDMNFRASQDPALHKRITSVKKQFPNALSSPEEFHRFNSHLTQMQMGEEMIGELEHNGMLGSTGIGDFWRKTLAANPDAVINDMRGFVVGQHAAAEKAAQQKEIKRAEDESLGLSQQSAVNAFSGLGEDLDFTSGFNAILNDPSLTTAEQRQAASVQLKKFIDEKQTSKSQSLSDQLSQRRLDDLAGGVSGEQQAKDTEAETKLEDQRKLLQSDATLTALGLDPNEKADLPTVLAAIRELPTSEQSRILGGIKEEEVVDTLILLEEHMNQQAARAGAIGSVSASRLVANQRLRKLDDKGVQVLHKSENHPNAFVVKGSALSHELPDVQKVGEPSFLGLFDSSTGVPGIEPDGRLIVELPNGAGEVNVLKTTDGNITGWGVEPESGRTTRFKMEVNEETGELEAVSEIPPVEYHQAMLTMVRNAVSDKKPLEAADRSINRLLKHINKTKSKDPRILNVKTKLLNIRNDLTEPATSSPIDEFTGIRSTDRKLKKSALREMNEIKAAKAYGDFFDLSQEYNAAINNAYVGQ